MNAQEIFLSLTDEQRAYYDLCDEADALGIPVSLDDPRSPNSVPALAYAVEAEHDSLRR